MAAVSARASAAGEAAGAAYGAGPSAAGTARRASIESMTSSSTGAAAPFRAAGSTERYASSHLPSPTSAASLTATIAPEARLIPMSHISARELPSGARTYTAESVARGAGSFPWPTRMSWAPSSRVATLRQRATSMAATPGLATTTTDSEAVVAVRAEAGARCLACSDFMAALCEVPNGVKTLGCGDAKGLPSLLRTRAHWLTGTNLSSTNGLCSPVWTGGAAVRKSDSVRLSWNRNTVPCGVVHVQLSTRRHSKLRAGW